MKKASRAAAAKARSPKKKVAVRRLTLKGAAAKPEPLSPEEVGHLETLVKRFEESEKAWQRMTAPVEDDPYVSVEEHLLQKRADDSERRWKFFSK